VEADVTIFAMNAVNNFDELDYLDQKASFFLHLAGNTDGERFTELENAPGQRPMALQRLSSALHKQNALLVNDDCAHANERRAWILAPNWLGLVRLSLDRPGLDWIGFGRLSHAPRLGAGAFCFRRDESKRL
jgi:hypothetical protein